MSEYSEKELYIVELENKCKILENGLVMKRKLVDEQLRVIKEMNKKVELYTVGKKVVDKEFVNEMEMWYGNCGNCGWQDLCEIKNHCENCGCKLIW